VAAGVSNPSTGPIMEIGVFVFDENGNFVEILTQGMSRHNHG